MSKPAQLPPDGVSYWERAIHASTEILLASLSFIAGLSVAMGATWTGLLAGDQALLVGPLTIGVTGLTYLGIEHFLANDARPGLPLLDEPESIGRCVLIALLGIILAQAGSALIAVAQTELFGIEAAEQDTIVELVERGDQMELLILGISAVILAPMTEELLFRYMFFRRLVHRTGIAIAFGLSAMAFSLIHFNPTGVIIYVWLGLVFAATYRFTGRIWVAMLAHAGYNATAFAILVWAPSSV